MTPDIERLARAIVAKRLGFPPPYVISDEEWGRCNQDSLCGDATAILTALREPTEGMVDSVARALWKEYESGFPEQMRWSYEEMQRRVKLSGVNAADCVARISMVERQARVSLRAAIDHILGEK